MAPSTTERRHGRRSAPRVYIGTAGWTIPARSAWRAPGAGTHLERYAGVFRAVEINSSFNRPHKPEVYARWAGSTPPDCRFAVKVPRAVTHEARLRRARPLLSRFLDETAGLGSKRGPLLLQLPPSLPYDARVMARFLDGLRSLYAGAVVCEPRHHSWFGTGATRLLKEAQIARVAADPSPVQPAPPAEATAGLAYIRLHGSPAVYWSPYQDAELTLIATTIRGFAAVDDVWCIFDNTAAGAAFENAWALLAQLRECPPTRPRARRAVEVADTGDGDVARTTGSALRRPSEAGLRQSTRSARRGRLA